MYEILKTLILAAVCFWSLNNVFALLANCRDPRWRDIFPSIHGIPYRWREIPYTRRNGRQYISRSISYARLRSRHAIFSRADIIKKGGSR